MPPKKCGIHKPATTLLELSSENAQPSNPLVAANLPTTSGEVPLNPDDLVDEESPTVPTLAQQPENTYELLGLTTDDEKQMNVDVPNVEAVPSVQLNTSQRESGSALAQTTSSQISKADQLDVVQQLKDIHKTLQYIVQELAEGKKRRQVEQVSNSHEKAITIPNSGDIAAKVFKEDTTLLPMIKDFKLKPDETQIRRIERWLTWRKIFLEQFKAAKIEPAAAVAVMKSRFPEDFLDKLPPFDNMVTPEKVADAVNQVVFGDNDIGFVTWKGIHACIHSRVTSGAELLKRINHWFTADPELRNCVGARCKFAILLLPERARNLMREWTELREHKYQALWDRMNREISYLVPNQEMISIRRGDQLQALDDDGESYPNKRRRGIKKPHSRVAEDNTSRSTESFKPFYRGSEDKTSKPFQPSGYRSSSNNQERSVCDYCQKPGHYRKYCVKEKEYLQEELKKFKKRPLAILLCAPTMRVPSVLTDETVALTLPSHTSSTPLMFFNREQMFVVKFDVGTMSQPLMALINSGANSQFISRLVIQKFDLDNETERHPQTLNVSSALNQNHTLDETIVLLLKVNGWMEPVRFLVLDDCPTDAILGLPFIEKYCNQIQWDSKTFAGVKSCLKGSSASDTLLCSALCGSQTTAVGQQPGFLENNIRTRKNLLNYLTIVMCLSVAVLIM